LGGFVERIADWDGRFLKWGQVGIHVHIGFVKVFSIETLSVRKVKLNAATARQLAVVPVEVGHCIRPS
jgi:hypothetical protein